MTLTFSVESQPAAADINFLEDRLYDYNIEQTGVDDGQWLAIFVRDEHQVIQAGVEGWTWCGSCYLRHVWVHRDLRGQSLGTQLLQAVEQQARLRGCQQIVLTSFSFQAPGFYRKLGYEEFAVLPGHPRGHHNVYLCKQLT